MEYFVMANYSRSVPTFMLRILSTIKDDLICKPALTSSSSEKKFLQVFFFYRNERSPPLLDLRRAEAKLNLLNWNTASNCFLLWRC